MAEDVGRMLVVDDNEMNRDILVRRLKQQGFAVGTAENGRLALDALRQNPYDVVLLDVMMPEMDGYETLQHMQKDEELRRVRVIMISALDAIESVVKCIELGADDYLTKPFNAVLLKARIDSSLARKRLADRERQYAEALERDLEIGREIQAGFLPSELPALAGWDMAARFHAARQVAGDFYDAFTIPGTGLVALVIADVCDKGVGAALFMALFRSLLRATATQSDGARVSAGGVAGEGGSVGRAVLHRAVVVTNDYIARTHGSANMFATVFFAVLDPSTGRLDYINGGHESPVVVYGDGRRARLTPTGPAVGMLPEMEFGIASVELEPGATLVAFTDGITEARAADGGFFGEDAALALLDPPPRSAAAALDRIADAVFRHGEGASQSDDITLLAARRST